MAEVPRIAILASGNGSTAEQVVRDTQNDRLQATVNLVICNNPPTVAKIYNRVASLNYDLGVGIAAKTINGSMFPGGTGNAGEQTIEESTAILDELNAYDITHVLLLGYMKRVRGPLLEGYGFHKGQDPIEARMLNTHPGLLPQTAGNYGIHIQEQVLERGLHFAGQTLHVVAEGYDTGPIVAEHRFQHGIHIPLEQPNRTEMITNAAARLFTIVQGIEKRNIGPDVQNFIAGRHF